MKYIARLYFVLIVFTIVFSYAFVDVNQLEFSALYTGISGKYRFLVTLIYFILISFYFGFYIIFVKNKLKLGFIKKIILISSLLIFAYPSMVSYDIYNYILTGKVTFFYFENPYVVMPIEFANEPMLSFTHAANKYALYGPFWILISGIPLLLGFGKLFLTILSFKIFVFVFYLITVFIINKLSGSLTSTIFFALNPLVLIETFISGHNDIVMMGLCMGAFYMITRNRMAPAVFLLTASILIKYSTIFIVPLFVYFVFKKMNVNNLGKIGFISMFMIFAFSAFRVEIYPWYAIWFLVFASLVRNNKFFLAINIALSFSLMLRYLPYMFLGTHFGPSPALKFIFTIVPPIVVLIYFITHKKLNLKF